MTTAHCLDEKWRSKDVMLQENVDFSSLLLSDLVQHGLTKAGFVRPSPIQLKAIPLGKCGLDLIVQAKSGTGKTCIFAVIALENILLNSYVVQTLVLAPTREIATQICDVIRSIGVSLPELRCHYFIGGLPLAEDIAKLKRCQIAVGTPGRIKQLIELEHLKTKSIRLFVLDEADKLLDPNFKECINWIYKKLPHNKQMLALSATYPEELAKLLTYYMRNPAFVRLSAHKPALIGLIQFYRVTPYHPLTHVSFQYKIEVLLEILKSVPFSQCLVFINLQMRAQSLCEQLNRRGWSSSYIYGGQSQQDRLKTMERLKSFRCRVLVTTDLTARGIDCENVNMVINIDLPKELETYLHRIGRAGRFGSQGLSISIVSEGSEKQRLLEMKSLAFLDLHVLPFNLSSDVWKFNSIQDDNKYDETDSNLGNDNTVCILEDDVIDDLELQQNVSNEKTNKQPHVSPNNTVSLNGHTNCGISTVDAASSDIQKGQQSVKIINSNECTHQGTLNDSEDEVTSDRNEGGVPLHSNDEKSEFRKGDAISFDKSFIFQISASRGDDTDSIDDIQPIPVCPDKFLAMNVLESKKKSFFFDNSMKSQDTCYSDIVEQMKNFKIGDATSNVGTGQPHQEKVDNFTDYQQVSLFLQDTKHRFFDYVMPDFNKDDDQDDALKKDDNCFEGKVCTENSEQETSSISLDEFVDSELSSDNSSESSSDACLRPNSVVRTPSLSSTRGSGVQHRSVYTGCSNNSSSESVSDCSSSINLKRSMSFHNQKLKFTASGNHRWQKPVWMQNPEKPMNYERRKENCRVCSQSCGKPNYYNYACCCGSHCQDSLYWSFKNQFFYQYRVYMSEMLKWRRYQKFVKINNYYM